MRTVKRPRRYIPRQLLAICRPLFRYSEARDPYVLRIVGRKWGPVLRPDRRHGTAATARASRSASVARYHVRAPTGIVTARASQGRSGSHSR
jgi:hypothetical protein